MKTVTVRQMRAIDEEATRLYSIPRIILMELAGLGVAKVAREMLRPQKMVAIFCGRGNNGGDGFVAARHLINCEIEVKVYLVGRIEDVRGSSLVNLNILKKMKQKIEQIPDLCGIESVKEGIKGAGLIIDALLGIGLRGRVKEPYLTLITFLNQADRPILSVDTPSGLDADSGRIMGACVKATKTVTMAVAKKGFFQKKAPSFTGELKVIDIGIPRALLESYLEN